MSWLVTLLSFSFLINLVSGGQGVFNSNHFQYYESYGFTPVGDLKSLSQEKFTTLSHPAFPAHSVRLKKSTFCDGNVSSYTGYIDIEARHLFFYFFESRSDPDTDDVVLWTNGGPGGSSAVGLFMELGPCRIIDDEGPKYHPESWNSKANLFFIDQPVGVGFSYADHGESVSTTEDAAIDIAAFVSIFFENFSKFKGRSFHLSGESYAGRYLPLFASAIHDQNALLTGTSLTPINLTSIIIGNGLTDYFTMMPAYYDMVCTSASLPPVLSISTCVRMKQALARCEKWVKASCIDIFDGISCAAAMQFCENEITGPVHATDRNPYDLSKKCEGEDSLCYPLTQSITAYLNRPEVQQQLGVDGTPTNYTLSNPDIFKAFIGNLDHYHMTYHYIAALLERNIKVLIYAGTYDFMCNYIGNDKWTLDLEWTGREEYVTQTLREWKVDGEVAGLTRSAKGLTFTTLYGAGHMVPYDKPKESLEMLNRWLSGIHL